MGFQYNMMNEQIKRAQIPAWSAGDRLQQTLTTLSGLRQTVWLRTIYMYPINAQMQVIQYSVYVYAVYIYQSILVQDAEPQKCLWQECV